MRRNHILRSLFLFIIGVSVASQPALSQHAPGGGAGGAGAGGGIARPTSPTPRTNNTNMDALNRSVYLSGKVLMDDGSAPPEPVVIERVCNGAPRAEGYTDSKGRFSFQLGQSQAMTQDASYDDMGTNGLQTNAPARRNSAPVGNGPVGGAMRGNAGQALAGCELRASLAGFKSDVVNLGSRRMFDNPDVGTIVLRRRANVEGTTISMTTLQAPKDARKAYEKAREALRKGKVADARNELEKAVSAYPHFAAAWYELGLIHEKANDPGEARRYYAQAIAADAKLVPPHLHLAQIAVRERKWQEAADTSGQVIKLDSYDFPDAFFYNAVANYNLQRFDAAEASARQTQKLDIAHRWPKADRVLGAILYEKQDYTGAAEQLRNYLTFAPDATDAGEVKAQLAELEKLTSAGKAKAERQEQ
ncbi:MAG TPA: tetratricopeptide repeat protein [Bryobacteraceae bacterium]|nr:tetratricopeptide repeat protein [Bryobacteraceae bacterium]